MFVNYLTNIIVEHNQTNIRTHVYWDRRTYLMFVGTTWPTNISPLCSSVVHADEHKPRRPVPAPLPLYIHLNCTGPPTLASQGKYTSKCCIALNHPGRNTFSILHISIGISFSNFYIVVFETCLAQSCL
jgi:hypothetical protein